MSAGVDGQYAVIAGFGLPGRAAAEALEARGVPYCVIELNVQTVSRCLRGGMRIIEGDAADAEVLRRAEVGRATLVVVAIPEEEVMLRVVGAARGMNGTCRIVARSVFLSTGMRAMAAGANEVVVAETLVAGEMGRVVGGGEG